MARTVEVTPETIKAAYEKINLKPIRHQWYHEGECCGLSALVLANSDHFNANERSLTPDVNDNFGTEEVEGLLGIPYDFVDGFITGFDTTSKMRASYEKLVKNSEYKDNLWDRAFLVGVKSAEAVGLPPLQLVDF